MGGWRGSRCGRGRRGGVGRASAGARARSEGGGGVRVSAAERASRARGAPLLFLRRYPRPSARPPPPPSRPLRSGARHQRPPGRAGRLGAPRSAAAAARRRNPSLGLSRRRRPPPAPRGAAARRSCARAASRARARAAAPSISAPAPARTCSVVVRDLLLRLELRLGRASAMARCAVRRAGGLASGRARRARALPARAQAGTTPNPLRTCQHTRGQSARAARPRGEGGQTGSIDRVGAPLISQSQ